MSDGRMWEFAVGLFMIQVWPESLLLAAIYGLTEAASIAVFGVVIGNWVDRNPRLKVCVNFCTSHVVDQKCVMFLSRCFILTKKCGVKLTQ